MSDTALNADCAKAVEAVMQSHRLTERQRIAVGLNILLGTNRPDHVAALRFSANRINEHGDILVREAFETEAGS